MGAFALAIQDEIDIDADETMLYAENQEVAKGTSRLLDYVNSNTQRVAPRKSWEKPHMSRYEPTPTFKVARSEGYTGSRWFGRTEQSQPPDLLPSKST